MATEKLSTEDYNKLKAFIGYFCDWYEAIPNLEPEHHPLAVAARIEKEYGLANAKRGAQMAINDIVEDTADWTPEQVAAADAKFAGHNSFTLSEVRQRYSRKYLQLLKRGSIRTEQEYYLLKNIYDGGMTEPGAGEMEQMGAMLQAYEEKLEKRLARLPKSKNN
jgi:hypothetical protein